MHDGMPYGQNQRQGQGHSREVDRQSPGLIFYDAPPNHKLDSLGPPTEEILVTGLVRRSRFASPPSTFFIMNILFSQFALYIILNIFLQFVVFQLCML